MASCKIILRQPVEETLRSLPKSEIGRILKEIEALKTEPVPKQSVKLAGAEQLYRVGVGDWRVVYEFNEDANQIMVYHLRRRRGILRRV